MEITLSNSILSRIGMTNQISCPREGGGYFRFQVTGMIGLGLKFSIPGFFGGHFGRYYFGWLDLSRDFWVSKEEDLWFRYT